MLGEYELAILAEASDPSSLLTPATFINFGVLGLIVLAFLSGWMWTKPSVDKLIEEKDRAVAEREKADAQRDAMAEVLQEKLLPVVGDFITTTRTLLPILQQLQQLQQMIPILQEFLRSGEYDPPPQTTRRGRRSKHEPDPPPHPRAGR